MKIISHRGNIKGLNPKRENAPSYIDCALQLGYDVEVDIRLIEEELWLGHDEPQYKITLDWLLLRKEKLWIHCKDLFSASLLHSLHNELKYFCHIGDPIVLVSNGMLWVHDLSLVLDDKCVIPLLSEEQIFSYKGTNKVYAVCTDHVNSCKKYFIK